MATYTVKLINDSGLDVSIEVPEDQYIFEVAEEQGLICPFPVARALVQPVRVSWFLERWINQIRRF